MTSMASKNDNKNTLISMFKNFMNILRDNEALTGVKALIAWTNIFILKLIEPRIGNEIDIENYNYDFDLYPDLYPDPIHHKNTLFNVIKYSNLIKESEENISNITGYLWDDILSKHHLLKNIFGKECFIKNKNTFKKIFEKLNTIDLVNIDYDVLGNAYEEVFKDIMTGKVFGQFFTQPLIKKLMVKLIDPKIQEDGTIESCCDPTMGTAGFLIDYLKCILEQAKTKNIEPNWNSIKEEIYGKEVDEATHQLACSNMLISSGHTFEFLEKGDSIRVPITKKFDIVMANPPFGIKGLKYDDFDSPLKNQYTPIKTDNAVSLFIQAIIYMLKINGRCAVVLPDGQDLFSKTNKTLVAVREYLMKTCDLREIIYMPSGIFNYTNIKTCIFYFVKKMEGTDVLEAKSIYTKTQKEKGKEYKFSKIHQTETVKFYNYNFNEDVKTLLVEVPIEQIAGNSYSLNYVEYLEKKEKEEEDNSVVIKTLGEVCEFKNGKNITKTNLIDGVYPVIGGGQKPLGFHNEYNTDENTILCSSSGAYSGFISKYDKKVWASDCFSIKSKTLNNNYLYYTLKSIQTEIYKLQIGTAQPHVNSNNLQTLKIPIPSLKRQEEIVKYLEFLETSNKISEEKIKNLKECNQYYLNNQLLMNGKVEKTLGEVCNFLPKSKRNAKYGNKEGLYPFFKSSIKVDCFVDEFDYNEESLIIGDGGEANINYGIKFSTSDHCYILQNKNKLLLNLKYSYYYLYHNLDIMNQLYTGIAIKNISKSSIEAIKIQIPLIERQNDIVEYLESNDKIIQSLEEEIKKNKKQSKIFLREILNTNEECIEIDETEEEEELTNEIIES
jgi:type I restriction-modification system DNA methylase subunit